MGLKNISIKGADDYAGNSDGAHYKATKQVSASQTLVHKVNIYGKTTIATPLYLWLFDAAAGSGASADPKHVRLIQAGVADTWDFDAGGSLFKAGVYLVIATNEPTDPTTVPTAAADDLAIVTVDFR